MRNRGTGTSRRDMAINDDGRLDDRRPTPHQVQPPDAQSSEFAPTQSRVGEEQDEPPVSSSVSLRRGGVLAHRDSRACISELGHLPALGRKSAALPVATGEASRKKRTVISPCGRR